MPRDNDKNNGRPPRRGAGEGYKGGGKGRSGGGDRPARSGGGDKKFGDRKFGDKRPAARAYGGKSEGFRKDGDRPRFSRDDRPSRGPRKEFGAGDREERRSFKPREDRGERSFGGGRGRDDRAPRDERSDARPSRGPRKELGAGERGERRPFKPREDRGERSFGARSRDDRAPRGERSDARPSRSGGFGDKKFGEKRPYTPRGEGRDARPARFDRGDRPQRDDRPRFNRDDRGERGAPRGPKRDFQRGEDRSNEKPWESRAPRRDDARRSDRPRDDRGPSDRPRFSRSREDRPERDERQSFRRPRFERDGEDRAPRGRSDWQEHPRSEGRERGSHDDRPRRDNEDDSRIFTKRPAFGGRGAYRERKPDFEKRAPRAAPKEKKTGDRIAKVIARAGVCSRRDAEEWITQGRVSVNGRVITSPALDVTKRDVITLDGQPLPERERTRLFLYHKPRGLMTTHDDPEGRPTVFDNLPEGLPRLISVGRLDFNTEGLLLLTNDGGLARSLELPDTGWLRRYRVRAHGEVTQAQLDELKKGVEVDGVKYGSIEATLERDQGSNVWIVFAIREGKNREVRNVMAHLGLEVNRLIRVSYGPFQLGEIEEGQVEEIRSRVLREQLGEKIVTSSGAHFDAPTHERSGEEAQRAKAAAKPKREVVADRKGRRVLVQRTGSEEARARNEERAEGGPPRRPRGGYKGKRDIKPEADFTED